MYYLVTVPIEEDETDFFKLFPNNEDDDNDFFNENPAPGDLDSPAGDFDSRDSRLNGFLAAEGAPPNHRDLFPPAFSSCSAIFLYN